MKNSVIGTHTRPGNFKKRDDMSVMSSVGFIRERRRGTGIA